MYSYSRRSQEVLSTLHPKLQLVMMMAIQVVDICLIDGLRDKETQDKYFRNDTSHVQWPYSRHNKTLDPLLDKSEVDVSDAVDAIPWPTQYRDKEQMILAAGVILACAALIGVELRWGGDWDRNGIINNKRDDFFDCWHFELVHK